MNTTTLLLLFADMAEKLLNASRSITLLAGIASVLLIMFSVILAENETERLFKVRKYSIVTFLISLAIFIITPSSKTIYIVAGANVTNELLQTETANKAIKLLNQKLDEALGETK
ncbi:hypothetical protein [Campylobacter mucosalis]|uniref:Putative membrane protein n=1 Tax=Campylobacter mucosalis CCUG 21559 TaxID=1032067 RepID=A0A6G5QGW0_9BACT|nr:hypothetical protein [Campylobacter mucosalis]QCD44943.1 putative membrane protein [Campylobacter mucosalis CCUG 21559]